MTLNTAIYIHQPIDPRPLFAYINAELLNTGPDNLTEDVDMSAQFDWYAPGSWQLGNVWGQGYAAALKVNYRRDGELLHDGSCDEDCAEVYAHRLPCQEEEHHPAHYVRVNLDTSYGYSDEHGDGAGRLHARLVAHIGSWLTTRGVTWSWRNEFTGDIYRGTDGLDTLMGDGEDARAWLTSILPLLAQ